MIGPRSFLFNGLFYLWTALVLIVCLPLLTLLAQPSRVLFRAGRLWALVNLAMLRGICNLTHEVRGLENLPAGACIVAAKHQSAWDTVIFSTFIDGPSYVLKRELLKIPLFGKYVLAAGCIPIDRGGGAGALRQLIGHAQRSLAAGRKIVIFPEGTRVAPGAHVPYHPGTAALYAHVGVPIVPVVLNSGMFWGRRSFLRKPGRIVLEILPPIAPGMPRKAFAALLEKQLETASERLLESTSPGPPGPGNRALGSCG